MHTIEVYMVKCIVRGQPIQTASHILITDYVGKLPVRGLIDLFHIHVVVNN